MTPANDNPGEQAGERILDHHRQQLSALMDGALLPDEARFLLRRLQHDEELAGCWTRWQLCGDVMRGQASMLLPTDFAQRVAQAIVADAGAGTTRRGSAASTWAHWGGGAALAASVAVLALFVTRQAPEARISVDPPSAIVAQTPVAPMPAPSAVMPAPPMPVPDPAATQVATAIAMAAVPRRMAARRSRGQSQRAAIRTAARANEPQVAVATSVPAPANPFAMHTAGQSRPWPRALLPESPVSGGFNVDYNNIATSPSFYPFAPPASAGMPVIVPNADGRGQTP